MELISDKSKEGAHPWDKAEQSDFEAVEALVSMSCDWKPHFKRYLENRPVTPVSDTSEEDSLLPGTPDLQTVPAFVSILQEWVEVTAFFSVYIMDL